MDAACFAPAYIPATSINPAADEIALDSIPLVALTETKALRLCRASQ